VGSEDDAGWMDWIINDGWDDDPGGGEDRGDGGSSSSVLYGVVSSIILYLTGWFVGVVAVVIMVAVKDRMRSATRPP
jgi:hypothetical protein